MQVARGLLKALTEIINASTRAEFQSLTNTFTSSGILLQLEAKIRYRLDTVRKTL